MSTTKPKPGRILILEDDSDILEVLKLMLEYEGHRVVTAKNGTTGLETLRKEKAFDLIVLDISMPDMSGIAVARQLRADPKTADMRIAIHTAVEERWVKERFPDYDLFFAKARDVDLLVDGIARLLAEPRRARPEPEPVFSADDAQKAQKALRDALGLGPESFSTPAFFRMLDDEIDQLRQLGRTDPEIAAMVGTAIGREVSPRWLAAPRDKRHG